jgi:hypothetical protein
VGVVVSVLQGCAANYIDSMGNRHVIGLVDFTLHSATPRLTFAGNITEITSLGISVGRTGQGGYITAGYSREVTAALRNNALVVGNPINLLTQSKHDQCRESQ